MHQSHHNNYGDKRSNSRRTEESIQTLETLGKRRQVAISRIERELPSGSVGSRDRMYGCLVREAAAAVIISHLLVCLELEAEYTNDLCFARTHIPSVFDKGSLDTESRTASLL